MDMKLPENIKKLEQEETYTSSELLPTPSRDKIKDNFNPFLYLFHGIRFDHNLSKLEGIFKAKMILAGQYLNNYFPYSDNANKGEYVSLLAYDESISYKIFIQENVSLLIFPECDALLTKYVDYETWETIKDINTKNLYSYLNGEYLVKDCIPFSYVAAIGVPYTYYLHTKSQEEADSILNSIIKLMNKYSISLTIIDTTNHNKVLYDIEQQKMRY